MIVVMVMMRRQDVGETPAPFVEHCADGACLGRVNGRRAAGYRLMDQNSEIVRPAGKLVNNERVHGNGSRMSGQAVCSTKLLVA